jgi:hypothetical protein
MPAHGLSIITARLQMCLLIFINFCNLVFLAPVAQLDRVLASEAKGRAFESRQVRHYSPCLKVKALQMSLGQRNSKAGAFAHLAFNTYFTVMALNNTVAYCKA